MAEKATIYKAKDGKVFENETDADWHDRKSELTTEITEVFRDSTGNALARKMSVVLEWERVKFYGQPDPKADEANERPNDLPDYDAPPSGEDV